MTAANPQPDTANAPASQSTPGRFRWVILGMLFGATTLNYMDRFLLGILKPTIMQDLKWTETDYANVVFCFQLAYAIGLITVSRIIDRLGTRAGLALVVGMCAIAAASHSLVSTVMGFCLARFALGIGESGCWPGCAKTVSEWFPRKERAVGMGVVNAGSSVGATITPLVVPLILKLVAWPFAFLFTAALDVLWVCLWWIGYRSPEKHPWLKKSELDYIRSDPNPPTGKVSWLQLFRHRQTWAFLLAKGLSDPVWWFYLFWVPGFLAKQYDLTTSSAVASAAAMALPVMVIYIMADIGSVSGGWLSMKLINRGWSINAARKAVMLGCALCVMPVFSGLAKNWPVALRAAHRSGGGSASRLLGQPVHRRHGHRAETRGQLGRRHRRHGGGGRRHVRRQDGRLHPR